MYTTLVIRTLLSFLYSAIFISSALGQEGKLNYWNLGFGPVGIADPLSPSFNLVAEKKFT